MVLRISISFFSLFPFNPPDLQNDLPEPPSLEDVDEEIAAGVEGQGAVAEVDDELNQVGRLTLAWKRSIEFVQ